MATKINYTLQEVDRVSEILINNITTKVLLFNGEMGSGKTTLIKALVKTLGSNDEVSSPTFSIVNEYHLNGDKIYHFDLYRVHDLEEALDFGIEDYLHANHWVFIEWPEIIKPLLKNDFDIINIAIDKNNRILSLTKTDQLI
ncbi:MAG: tRNA (adenosine(37)-N6)-threonylcarbamoyltransferase complex ATPase subunit type 1 TsaE [Flavobacteriaceae bacterium]